MSRLKDMIGVTICDMNSIHGYWQIHMGPAVLTVFVPITVAIHGISVEPKAAIGSTIKDVIEGDCSIKFMLSNDSQLTIDISPEQYICPEAMVLTQRGYSTVVW